MTGIDLDSWKFVQSVWWRLKEDERCYAVYEDAGSEGFSYIALTNKRVLIPDWEFLYEDITHVEKAPGFEVGIRLHTLEGKATLLFLGERQAGYAYKIINSLRGGK